MDPRRPYFLAQILLSAPTMVPNLGEVSAGSTLVFAGTDTLYLVHEAAGRQFHTRGFTIDGHESIGFRDGHPASFHLAKHCTVGGYHLAAGTVVDKTFGYDNWGFTLANPLALPEVTLLPGDKLYFHASLKYPVYAVHRKAIELGKKQIKANDLIFLKRNGRIKTREH